MEGNMGNMRALGATPALASMGGGAARRRGASRTVGKWGRRASARDATVILGLRDSLYMRLWSVR